VVNRASFTWQAAPHVTYDHDFAKRPLRHRKSIELHRRIDSDYNGWWMCLFPRVVVEKLGLPLPLFIKWDDAEYSLRAQAAGHQTVSLPGAAIWHMPWSDKDDATDWQAYFHLRNRLVVAALHSAEARPTAMIKYNLKTTLKHLMSLEYSTVALREMAMDDFLAGPAGLFPQLGSAMQKVRRRRSRFPDGQILASARDLPYPSGDPVLASRFLKPPANPVTIGAALASGLVHNLLPVKPSTQERPQLNIPAQDARWFLLARLDGVTVSTADGRGVVFRKRNPRLFWSFLLRALADNLRLARDFPRLRRRYREAFPTLTATESWLKAFASDVDR
jgi:galactofuranosylgalactofuranosylrhamnosyl-N-acetylglucosaminyl-diphospho-decaprenol beta-1,5/1,6-galactofuranosyltransferase